MVTNVDFVYLLHMQTSKTEALTMGTHRREHSILNKKQPLSKLYMIMRTCEYFFGNSSIMI
jgi:hypothetical protein